MRDMPAAHLGRECVHCNYSSEHSLSLHAGLPRLDKEHSAVSLPNSERTGHNVRRVNLPELACAHLLHGLSEGQISFRIRRFYTFDISGEF